MNKKREREIMSTSSPSVKLSVSSFIYRVSGLFKRRRYTRNSDASFITVRNDIGNNAHHCDTKELSDERVGTGTFFIKSRSTMNEISCNGSASSFCVNTQTSGRVQTLNANYGDTSPPTSDSIMDNNDNLNDNKTSIMSSLSKCSTRLVTNDVVNSRYIPQFDISTAIDSNLKEERKIDTKNDQSRKEKESNGFNRSKGFGKFDNNDIPYRFPYRKHFTNIKTHLEFSPQISTNMRKRKLFLPGDSHLEEKDRIFRFQKNVNNTKGLTRRSSSRIVSHAYRPASRLFTSISRQNSADYGLIPSSLSSNSFLSFMDKEKSRKMREKCNIAVAKSILESTSRTFLNSRKIDNDSKSIFGPPSIKMSPHGLKDTNGSRLVCYEAPTKNKIDVVEEKHISVQNDGIENFFTKDSEEFVNSKTLSTDLLPNSSVDVVKSVLNQDKSTASSAHVTMSRPVELRKWIGDNHGKFIKSRLKRNENGSVFFPTFFLFGNMINCNKELGIGDFGVPSSDTAAKELIEKTSMRKDSLKTNCHVMSNCFFSSKRQSSLPERMSSSTSTLSSNNFTFRPDIKKNEYNDGKVTKVPYNFMTISRTIDSTHPVKAIPIVNDKKTLNKREKIQVELDTVNNDKKLLRTKYGLGFLEKKKDGRRCNMCTYNNEKNWLKCELCGESNLEVHDDDKNTNNSTYITRKVLESMKNDLKTTDTDGIEGFGNIFAPNPGEWRCNGCFIKNSKDISRCLACEKEKSLNNRELSQTVNVPECTLKSKSSSFKASTCEVSEENSNILDSKSIFQRSFMDCKSNFKLLDNCNPENVHSKVSFGCGQSDSKNSLSPISNHSQLTLEFGSMVPNKETTTIPRTSFNSKSDNFGKIKRAITYSSLQTNVLALNKERVVATKESLLKVKSGNSNLFNGEISTLNNKHMLDSHAMKNTYSGPSLISSSKSPSTEVPIPESCIDSSRVNNPFSFSKPSTKNKKNSFCDNSGIRMKSAFSFSEPKNISIRSKKVNKLVLYNNILFGNDTRNITKHESKSADTRQNGVDPLLTASFNIGPENVISSPNQFIEVDPNKQNISNTKVQPAVSVETFLGNDAINNSTKLSSTNGFGANFLAPNISSANKSDDLVSSSSSVKFPTEATSEKRTFTFGKATSNSIASLSATENTQDIGTSKYLSNLGRVKSSAPVFQFGTQSSAHANTTDFCNRGFTFSTLAPTVPPSLSVGVESCGRDAKNISSTMHQSPHKSLNAQKPTTSSLSFGVSSSTPIPPTNPGSSTLSFGRFGVPTSLSMSTSAPVFGTGTATGVIPLNGGFSIGIGGGKNSGIVRKSGRRIVRARRPPVSNRL